ncbi:MAG: hypothetical protein Q4G27_08405 [Flavobacteriaceae bacterium]|nr:hypothetical protein [Flavobacteriaceae bacterium]
MFKKVTILFLTFLLIQSCDKKEDTISDVALPTEKSDSLSVKKTATYSTAVLDNWMDYYNKNVATIRAENFSTEESFKLVRTESTTIPIWNKNFNPVYKDFLIYNADSTMYVDIDSYKWGFDDKGLLVINPDQEIVLVNIPEKKSERLLFYGPSYWVEDAYFKNDSIVVLLENSTDRIPAYQEINLKSNTSKYFLYDKSLDSESDYYKNRISRIYPKMP